MYPEGTVAMHTLYTHIWKKKNEFDLFHGLLRKVFFFFMNQRTPDTPSELGTAHICSYVFLISS